MEAQLGVVPWDVVVIDEAHKLRNAHRKSHETGQSLKRSLAGRKKLLLTATPLQNSLMELFGLTSLIDEEIFGDERSFRSQYGNGLVRAELLELDDYIRIARSIREDQKSHALLSALQQGFERMGIMGAARKAVIFTESRRTQEYLARFLEAHGYANKVTTFSGGNQGPTATGSRWSAERFQFGRQGRGDLF